MCAGNRLLLKYLTPNPSPNPGEGKYNITMTGYNRPDPSNWEYVWERGVSGVKKQARKVVDDVKRDVVESFGAAQDKSEEEKQAAQKKHETVQKQVAGSDRQKLTQIEAEIKRIGEEREKNYLEANKKTEQVKKQKDWQEQKKKETVLEKQIKSKKGTKEGMQRVSG